MIIGSIRRRRQRRSVDARVLRYFVEGHQREGGAVLPASRWERNCQTAKAYAASKLNGGCRSLQIGWQRQLTLAQFVRGRSLTLAA
jgi:hypothetical protein